MNDGRDVDPDRRMFQRRIAAGYGGYPDFADLALLEQRAAIESMRGPLPVVARARALTEEFRRRPRRTRAAAGDYKRAATNHRTLCQKGRAALLAGLVANLIPAAANADPSEGQDAAANAAPTKEERSWRAGVNYTTDIFSSVSGGLDRGTAWLGRADATLEADGEAFGLPGARFFFGLIYTHGPDFSGEYVGDAQVPSNVQGDGILRPYEAYVVLPLAEGLTAKGGLIDLNTEFDVQSVGAFFTNSSHGIGIDFSQSGRNGPSIFPVTSGAAMIRRERGNWRVSSGLFNAVSGDPDRPRRFPVRFPGKDGSLLVSEAAVSLAPELRAQAGAWVYTSKETIIDVPDQQAHGSKGAYGQLELALSRGESGAEIGSWVRAGTASGRTNRVTAYIGGGVTYGTDRGRIGLAVAHARQSDRAREYFSLQEGAQARAESSIELGYGVTVGEHLMVQPVVHYVANPGWRSDVSYAVVLGVRFSLAFEH